MKKYLVTMMLSGLFVVGAYAQDMKTAKVPKVVKAGFMKRFPEKPKGKVSGEKEKGN